MQRGQKPNARRRKLNYQRSVLREELDLYNKQKEILPLLFVLGAFGALFLITSNLLNFSGKSYQAQKQDNVFTIEIPAEGLYQINIENKISGAISAPKDVKTEVFVQKEGEKLYHYFLTADNLSDVKKQTINYYFRKAGNYTVKFSHTLPFTSLNQNLEMEADKLSFKTKSGNRGLLVWGMRLYILAVVIILVLKDYFGDPKNYSKILKNKELKFSGKSFYLALIISCVWFAAGYYLASTGYGYAGYKNDMHAPASGVKLDNNYYVN